MILIGERLELKEIEVPDYSFNLCYELKYKINKVIEGEYNEDTISFLYYSHYGKPLSSDYNTDLLFIYNLGGEFVLEKYMFFPLHISVENKWVVPYSPSRSSIRDSLNRQIAEPLEIEFKKAISHYIKNWTQKCIKENYPEPYYEIKEKEALTRYGYYVDDYIRLITGTVLEARGYTFDDRILKFSCYFSYYDLFRPFDKLRERINCII